LLLRLRPTFLDNYIVLLLRLRPTFLDNYIVLLLRLRPTITIQCSCLER
jgi:hypothetical protein